MPEHPDAPWSPADSATLYGLADWGGGYFDVSDRGTVRVRPDGTTASAIDMLDLVEGLEARDLATPVVLRFDGILEHRMAHIRRSFDTAIAEAGYTGTYTGVYPIKVNQQRHICEQVRDLGQKLGFGLEAGSKPELLAGLALTRGLDDMPFICNGFKDGEFIETVILASKMGRNILPVVEQKHELDLLIEKSALHDVKPRFGIRAKLASGGIGRWASSVGFRGKFGLSVSQILEAVESLRELELLEGMQMLHCHIGSQIFDIRTLKSAVSELTHIYVELVKLGAPMGVLDLGGGLGVDYDGTGSAADSSVNYTLEQYASEIVYRVQAICDDADVPHPNLITESGRAIVAHSGVLVFQVLGSRVFPDVPNADVVAEALAAPYDDVPQPLLDLHDAWERLQAGDDPVEIHQDAEYALGEAMSLFSLGYMGIKARAATEELYWSIANQVLRRVPAEDLPEGMEDLEDRLGDLYFSNFSLFQSLIDAWAIDQVFPVMPIHRLNERPTRRGILSDITCDSDGKLDHFPGAEGVRPTVPLHELRRGNGNGGPSGSIEPYYLAVFLTGAYQETLGDLHNLFGDTHAVHVRSDGDGGFVLEEIVEGDSVSTVLKYVQFDPQEMRRSLRKEIEKAVQKGRLSLQESVDMRRFLDDGLDGYTYLE